MKVSERIEIAKGELRSLRNIIFDREVKQSLSIALLLLEDYENNGKNLNHEFNNFTVER